MRLPPEAFIEIAKRYINANSDPDRAVSERVFKAHFRLSPIGCAGVWERLEERVDANYSYKGLQFSACQPSHLLWTLYHAWCYSTEDTAAAFFGVTAKTYRKYVLSMMGFIAKMGWSVVS